ncbi:MAG: hypothetical protein QXR81_08540, partial [Candidatus Nezhaarchaeales archaeon]
MDALMLSTVSVILALIVLAENTLGLWKIAQGLKILQKDSTAILEGLKTLQDDSRTIVEGLKTLQNNSIAVLEGLKTLQKDSRT